MRLTLINGSPRGLTSNTLLLLEEFAKGYQSISKEEINVVTLKKLKSAEEQKSTFENSEILILGFPLYTDAMPGIVKDFFENLNDYTKSNNNPHIGFLVQSGFPEAYHSIFIEKYLERLVSRFNSKYLGTIIKGGVEGIKIQPKWMTKTTFYHMYMLGEKFAQNHELDNEIIQKLRTPLRLTPTQRTMYSLMRHFGLTNFYWDSQLKKNKVFDQRFAKPYN
jgi:Flavodoxin-like fold